MRNRSLLNVLAASFLAGELSVEQVAARGQQTLGRRWRWLRPLARRYVDAFAGKTRPRRRDVVRFLAQDQGFRRAQLKYSRKLSVKHWLTNPQQMQPAPAARAWGIPTITSAGNLAEWLGISGGELQWFADLKGLRYRRSSPRLRHYHYRILLKRSGSVRLIEEPKARLKTLQRQILKEILDKIPPIRRPMGSERDGPSRHSQLCTLGSAW